MDSLGRNHPETVAGAELPLPNQSFQTGEVGVRYTHAHAEERLPYFVVDVELLLHSTLLRSSEDQRIESPRPPLPTPRPRGALRSPAKRASAVLQVEGPATIVMSIAVLADVFAP